MDNKERKPIVKFSLEKPVKGKFTFSEPKSGISQYGEYNLYGYEDEAGETQMFSASKGLHKKLSAIAGLKDKKFTITKVLMKDENGNIKENKGQPLLDFKVEIEGDVQGARVAEEKEVDMDQIPF